MTSSSAISIRPAVVADIPQIHAFIGELATYEKLESEHTGTISDLERTLFGATSYAYVLIASLEGHGDVGFALYFFNYSTWLARPGLYLEDLYVRKEVRGLGVGNALLRALAKVANDRKCGRMEWCALDWNRPAIDFYRSLGAVTMDEFTTFRLSEEKIADLVQDL
ncbi:hypothetical protein HK101_001217 [Irineochytrium annulatum]|nr:hypothetical protein HK101_001217 [Irineochytrium annulatum]